jgi:two-component system alkaline phosphatase synthesis response regulator PhoP
MIAQRRILIVDDEPALLFMLTDRLEAEGYRVEAVDDGERGLARAAAEPFDAIILDGMLPGRDGFDVCQTLRQRGVRVPVLMLSARGQVVDRVVGLKLGADDYLTKPFDVSELLARLHALLRRAAPAEQGTGRGFSRMSGDQTFRYGDVTVDCRRAEVSKAGTAVELTAREFTLLLYFIAHRGATLSRNELLNEVWGYDVMPSTRTVDVHVALLRQKLETHPRKPRHLLTVFGLGYKFVE